MSLIDKPKLSNKYSLPPFSKIYFSGKDFEIILGNKFCLLKPSNIQEDKFPDGLCSSTTTIPLHGEIFFGKTFA